MCTSIVTYIEYIYIFYIYIYSGYPNLRDVWDRANTPLLTRVLSYPQWEIYCTRYSGPS